MGNVIIYGNDINNLNGLSVLTSIGGDLQIGDYYGGENPALTSLTGLDNLTSIGGGLLLSRNSSLASLTGLDNLTSIGGGLGIGSNYALTSLTGLEGLTSIGGILYIGYNDSLSSLTGLENLTSIGGDLYIDKNYSLTILTGLEGLASIGGDLYIDYNESLTSLTGLEGLTFIGGDLTIVYNYQLSYCEIEAICAYLDDPNDNIYIYSNAPGCNSKAQVEAVCVGVGINESSVVSRQSSVSVYPNPTKGIVDFRFSMVDFRWVSLKIYDVHGREVATVLDGNLAAGEHVVRWDATGLPAGIYFYRISTIDHRQSAMGKIVKY